MQKPFLVVISLITSIILPGGTAQAQSGSALEEIVVTAQRREQSLQDVPISIQVLSDENLSRKQIHDMQGLSTVSATLIFDSGFGGKANSYGMRGVSTATSGSSSSQSSVGLVVDGIPVARSQNFIRDLGDVERVELLRGPQGTLFGKNSTAGVVNIVTKGPTSELDGFLDASATDDAEYLLRGAIGGPLTDRIRGRVFASYRDQNPLIENVSQTPGAEDVNGQEVGSISGKLEIDITDNVTALLHGYYTDFKGAQAAQLILIPAAGMERSNFPCMMEGARGKDLDCVNRDGLSQQNIDLKGGSADLTWNLNDQWQLHAMTGYSESYYDDHSDLDFGKCGIEDIGDPCVGEQGNRGGLSFGDEKPRLYNDVSQLSQEVQLLYTDSRTTFITGAFYEHVKEDFLQHSSSWLQDRDGDFIPDRVSDRARGPNHVDNKSYSIFGDVTRELTGTISGFVGLRYTEEEVEYDNSDTSLNRNISTAGPLVHDLTYIRLNNETVILKNVVDTPTLIDTRSVTPTNVYSLSKDVSNLSGRVGARWQPSDDRTYYVSYAKGFKAPGVDLNGGLAGAEDSITDEETSQSIEIGFKGEFANRHQLGLAAYYAKTKGIQQSSSVPFAIPLRSVLQNIGDIRSFGVEADFTFRITDQFDVTGSIAYTNAEMTAGFFDCHIDQTAAEGCNVDSGGGLTLQSLEGRRPTQSPEWVYQMEGNYFLPLNDRPFDAYMQLAWRWQDELWFEPTYDPVMLTDSYGLLDFAIGLTAKSGRYNVEFFGKNVLDTWYPVTMSFPSIYARHTFNATRNAEARFGLRTRINF